MSCQKLLMISLLQNFSFGEDNDVVGMLDRGQTMCHDKHGSDISHFLQGILDQKLGLRIDICRCLSRIMTAGS